MKSEAHGVRPSMAHPRQSVARKANLVIKRAIDIVTSAIGLVALCPLFAIAAILIKTTSRGPVFFVQDRLGKDMRVFRIIKFRTMVVGAEQSGDGLFLLSERDPRVTRIGKVLRKTSIDELPQLINVIKGDMSLVGPRPPVPHHPYTPSDYSEFQRRRFEMKPGITGLAQIRMRASAPWDARIRSDVEYVETFSVLLDLQILLQTARAVFLGRNVYPKSRESITNANKSAM